MMLFFAGPLFSQEKAPLNSTKIQGSRNLPLELNLILESLQSTNADGSITPISDSNLESLLHIDSYARVLTKEDIFLIGKIEIYKTLLKSAKNYPKAVIDGNSLVTLKQAIKNSTDPFIIWFLKTLLQDSETLLASRNYKDYLLQKNSGNKLEQVEFKKIDKKVKLLYRWVSKINRDSADSEDVLKLDLVPVMNDALKNIEESFYLMASNTLFKPLPELITNTNDFKFFFKTTVKAKINTEVKKEKSVDEILAPLTNEKPKVPILPSPSTESWLNDEFAPNSLKNLPKPTDDADWLRDF